MVVAQNPANDGLPAGPRPGERDTSFFDDPTTDHLLRAVVTLTMELSVTRERLAAVEALLAENGTIDQARLDAYEPAPGEQAKRAANRRSLIVAILDPLVSRLARKT